VRQAGFWVLHRSACPSVLIELGFISNPAEERYLTSDLGQNELSTAIFNAFVDYKRLNDKKSGIQSSLVPKIDMPSRQNDTDKIKQIDQQDTDKLVKNAFKPDSNSKQVTIVSQVKPAVSVSNQVKTNKPVFKVQLFATEKTFKLNSSVFKGLHNVDVFVENGLNKYTIGAETDYDAILKLRKSVLSKFPQAFIIAFLGDKKINASKAKKLVK
jgi:N-acetylmuramoyl-L-alanine amidase